MIEVRLSDAQWRAIVAGFQGRLRARANGNETVYRRFVEDVLRVAVNDLGWSRLQPPAGSWRTRYARFIRWSDEGRWDRIALALDDDPLLRDALLRRLDESRQARARLARATGSRSRQRAP